MGIMANQETSTTPGLKLTLEFIDSKLGRIEQQYKNLGNGKFGDAEERARALSRIYGADMALTQLRERIVRALGPDAE